MFRIVRGLVNRFICFSLTMSLLTFAAIVVKECFDSSATSGPLSLPLLSAVLCCLNTVELYREGHYLFCLPSTD